MQLRLFVEQLHIVCLTVRDNSFSHVNRRSLFVRQLQTISYVIKDGMTLYDCSVTF